MNTIKVGEKKRHLIVPDNYRVMQANEIVTEECKVANIIDVNWMCVEKDDIGLTVEETCADHVISPIKNNFKPKQP